MSTIFTIIKKEFARFFKDTRLMLTALILPGLLIFAVYSLMGTIISDIEKDSAAKPALVCVVNLPQSQSKLFDAFEVKEDYTVAEAMDAVKNGGLDLFVSFPDNFDGLIAGYQVSDGAAPNVEIFYNSTQTTSIMAYQSLTNALSRYEDTLVNKFDINRPSAGAQNSYDMADSVSTSRTVMSMVVPMVLLMLLFSGCMSVAPESIAGEKERGTIATLLVTPVKRSHIAIGKIAALSVIALLSGLSSTVGLVLSLPKLAGVGGASLTFSMYGFGDIAVIFAVILSTVLIMVTLISIVSAYAKSVKEASGLVVPLMILVMLCGIGGMFIQKSSIGLSFIPIFNSALAISSVMAGTVSAAAIAITVCTNLAFSALLVVALAFMFNSERIMFNK